MTGQPRFVALLAASPGALELFHTLLTPSSQLQEAP